jgi:hypothetical protein
MKTFVISLIFGCRIIWFRKSLWFLCLMVTNLYMFFINFIDKQSWPHLLKFLDPTLNKDRNVMSNEGLCVVYSQTFKMKKNQDKQMINI